MTQSEFRIAYNKIGADQSNDVPVLVEVQDQLGQTTYYHPGEVVLEDRVRLTKKWHGLKIGALLEPYYASVNRKKRDRVPPESFVWVKVMVIKGLTKEKELHAGFF